MNGLACYRDKIIFFDVLAVVAFRIVQTAEPLLEDRVLAVP
jgi:hypothetical protein